MYLKTCAQTWSESSLLPFWIAKDANFLHLDNEDFDKTARGPTGWFESSFGAHFRRYVFSRWSEYVLGWTEVLENNKCVAKCQTECALVHIKTFCINNLSRKCGNIDKTITKNCWPSCSEQCSEITSIHIQCHFHANVYRINVKKIAFGNKKHTTD